MKHLLLSALLLAGLAGCGGGKGPKFKNPVVVTANNTPIYEAMDSTSRIMVKADRGDTLEFDGVSPAESGRLVCRVMPDARYSRFPGSLKAGYIERRFVVVPDSTLAKDKAGTLRSLPNVPASGPGHLNNR